MTDGTSNTAMFSEHLLCYWSGGAFTTTGTPTAVGSPYAKRGLFQINSVSPVPDQGAAGVVTALALIAACRSLPGGDAGLGGLGRRRPMADDPGLRYV